MYILSYWVVYLLWWGQWWGTGARCFREAQVQTVRAGILRLHSLPRTRPSGSVAQERRWSTADQVVHKRVPIIDNSVNFWRINFIFGSFERALTVESAERITRIKSLLFRGNGYFLPCTRHREKLPSPITRHSSFRIGQEGEMVRGKESERVS